MRLLPWPALRWVTVVLVVHVISGPVVAYEAASVPIGIDLGLIRRVHGKESARSLSAGMDIPDGAGGCPPALLSDRDAG